jgi:sodium transport system permease protein
LLALLPAVVEELAFRGFILNGLRQASSNWSAVVVSAFAFGISHGILQQSLAASLVGLLLGWIAIRTGGIFTGIAYHVTHNALVQLRSDFGPAFEAWLDDNGLETAVLGSATGPERLFTPVFTLVCASIAAVLVWGMCRRHSAAQNPELQ